MTKLLNNIVFLPILICLVYFTVSLIFTYPLVFHMNSGMIGEYPGDSLNYIWNIFTFWNEIKMGNNPFFTKMIFYPIGANLTFHTYAPLVSIVALPFLKNLLFFINILVIASLATAAMGMFLLAKFLVKNSLIAFFCGLIYGFSPIMTSFIVSQHYYFAFAATYLPLGLLSLLKFFQTQSKKYFIFAAIIFWMCFLTDYYTTILYILISIIFSAFFLYREKAIHKKQLFWISKAIILMVLIPIIILFTTLFKQEEFLGKVSSVNSNLAYYCNTNLAGFIIPSRLSPHVANFADNIRLNLGIDKNYDILSYFDTPSYYLGISIFSLAIISFIKLRKNPYVLAFGIFGIVILLLSLGKVIRFGFIEILAGPETPFYWFSQLPFLGLIDCPIRFPIAAQLSIAALLGLLASQLIDRKILFKILFIIIIVLFILEYGVTNMKMYNIYTPNVYQKVATLKDDKSLLELPSGIAESKGAFGYDWSISGLHYQQLYWQTLHKKVRVGGYTSRVSQDVFNYFKRQPVIVDIFTMTNLGGKWPGRKFSEKEVKDFLNQFNIGFIIIAPNDRQHEFRKVTEDLLISTEYEFFEDQNYLLYHLKQE